MPDSNTDVSERLALLRTVRGPGQTEFCRRVGISPQAWNNYESGLRRISLDQAIAVCNATNVTLDWIYRGLTMGIPGDILEAEQRRQQKK